jgi:hypothetical protein
MPSKIPKGRVQSRSALGSPHFIILGISEKSYVKLEIPRGNFQSIQRMRRNDVEEVSR